ncbi:MAG: homogentisate phytyltransferase [Cyanobacteria bacterium P01_F01_bin.33]
MANRTGNAIAALDVARLRAWIGQIRPADGDKTMSDRLEVSPVGTVSAAMAKLQALWKFSRPHTIYGTSASVLGLYLLAREPGQFWYAGWESVAIALLVCLSTNVYIVGLNQLFDIEIDRVNKPNLPLASGAMSVPQGIAVVAALGTLGLALSGLVNRYLFVTVLLSTAIGTIYSAPPIRLKRFPFFAALCIYSVRGLVVNFGLFAYFRAVFGQSITPTPALLALVVFILVFTFAIAIFKDIPDMDGDRKFNIATFSLRLGQERIFNFSLGVLSVAYAAMAVACGVVAEISAMAIAIHLGGLSILWWARWQLKSRDRTAMYGYYQLIWKLFYLEYLCFPLTQVVGR